ncbi:MAG: adenylate/guanylate cyclase domain-containing protein [Planctomycetes bacterium]|nr:adenylate/guanylate cyclase domain-containing protein [Planctomycetota bacterium]
MIPAPSGLVTLVFTDLQGSTELWERHGDSFRPVLEQHHRIMRDAIAARAGFEVKTEGDSFMVAFGRASDALRFAMEAQQALHAHAWPASSGELLVRMGIHLGEPLCITDSATGRADYYGPAVNRAARIAAAAHGGQVLLSAAAWEAAAEVRSGIIGVDLGEHRLKGLERPERLWQALPQSLAARTFPPAKTLSARPTNLPEPATSFVGRDREIRELSAVLGDPSTRLVTLTGPGGTGKTRLSLRVAADLLADFEGGAWFADLSEARTAADVGGAVARGLGVTLNSADVSTERVATALEFRKPLLLILDNFEQVVAFAPETIGLWRKRAPEVRFLVTSRSVLGVEGEREFEVPPLGVPESTGSSRGTARLEAYDGVRLFLERAREADARFRPDTGMIPAIAELVGRLEGIPLAIEMAAARMKVLKPAEILARLDQRFQVLRSTRRDLPARQQTLLGAIDWSYDLLSPWEKSAFQQLGTFRGGFFLEDAEAVLDLTAFPDAPDAITAVQTLREKSFLRTVPSAFGTRFGMYLSLQEYGQQKWAEAATPAQRLALDLRHGARVVAEAERQEERQNGRDVREALDRQEADIQNLFAAQERALARGDGALAVRALLAVVRMLEAREGGTDILARLEAAWPMAADGVPPELRVRHAGALAALLRSATRTDQGSEIARAGMALAEATGQPKLIALSLIALHNSGALTHIEESINAVRRAAELLRGIGNSRNLRDAEFALANYLSTNNVSASLAAYRDLEARCHAEGDVWREAVCLYGQARNLDLLNRRPEALAAVERAGRIFEEVGDRRNVIQSTLLRGWLLSQLGDIPNARRCLRESISMLRESGDREGLALALHTLGNIEVEQQSWPEARALHEEGLRMTRNSTHKRLVSRFLCALGSIYTQTSEMNRAREALEESRTIAGQIGYSLGEGLASNRLMTLHSTQGNHASALAAAEDAIRLLRQCNAILLIDKALIGRGYALCSLGRYAEAAVQFDELHLRIDAATGGDGIESLRILITRARVLQVSGRIREAREARGEIEERIRQAGPEAEKLNELAEMRSEIEE